ncbi:IS5 family transposase [Bordetella sp. FB-8]|uniref:IS5 family transposase n=1 Tax=Bordetella sp. FB-8 TaxID=1159870 RepID=UPI00037CC9C6|nr:IS5 family transposase [Bordetella sp. FB-8]
MSQLSFSEAEYVGKRKQARREKFLGEMDRTIPWDYLAGEVAKHYPLSSKVGRQPYPIETMLRIHFMQQWFALSDPAMEEALYDSLSMRQFAQLPGGRVPDETTILNFRHLLEAHNIAEEMFEGVTLFLQAFGLVVRQGTIVDATIIDAPSSTKNEAGARDPEMRQTKKGKNYFFGMKAHIGVDLHTGLVHTVVGTPANVADVTQVDKLLHGQENLVLGDAGYQGVDKRAEHEGRPVDWHIALRPSLRKKLSASVQPMQQAYEHTKASLRAKVEHPFRVTKRQFGYTKVRYRGLAKNTAQLKTLFALANLWMARGQVMAAMVQVRP